MNSAQPRWKAFCSCCLFLGPLIFSLQLPLSGWAAIPSSPSSVPQVNDKVLVEGVKEALKLPIDNRLEALRSYGDSVFSKLDRLASNTKEPLEVRWRSITALGRLFPDKAQSSLEKALGHKQWFMRNAALIVLPYQDRAWAIKKIRPLLSDPALVVRTAAVQAAAKLKAVELEKDLWQKLSSDENFVRGQSLWVRHHIAEALVRFAKKGQEKSFVEMLTDDDERLHQWAIQGLQKLTGTHFQAELSPKERRAKWLSWWNEQLPSKTTSL